MSAIIRLILFFSTGLVASIAQPQGIPFGNLSGEKLNTTLQLEHLGASLWTERSGEAVQHSRVELFLPVAESDVDAYALQFRATRLLLDRDRTTTPTGYAVPRDLGSIAVGPFARRKLESGDQLAGDVQIGRSGIRLSEDQTATTVSANFFWISKRDENQGQWLYLLSYSNSRSTFNNVPLPGFAYMKTFTASSGGGLWAAGAPFFFVFYRGQPWSGSALLTPFTSFVEGSYSLVGPFAAFLRVGWQPQSFKLNGGPAERLLYEEFRTQLGVRGPIARFLMATAGAAYSDGRRLLWGDSLLRSTGEESRLDDEVSLFFNLNARF